MADEPVPAEIMKVIERTGIYGEVYQVMCKVLAGRDQGKVIRRNVQGPVRKGDVIILMETEREAKPIRAR